MKVSFWWVRGKLGLARLRWDARFARSNPSLPRTHQKLTFIQLVCLIVGLFYTICVYRTIRVWYIPYAYTHLVQPYAYGTAIHTICVHIATANIIMVTVNGMSMNDYSYIQLVLACSCSSLITQLAWSCIMHAVCIASYKPCYCFYFGTLVR